MNKFVRFLVATVIFFAVWLCLWLALNAIIHMPLVQSYVSKKGIDYASQLLDTEITVDGVYVDIWNRLAWHDVLVKDWDCDTLLYVKELYVNVDKIALLQQKVNIEAIALNNAYVHLKRPKEERFFNIDYVLSKLKKSKSPQKADTNTITTPQKKPLIKLPNEWQLNLANIKLNNVFFWLDDVRKRTDLRVKLPELNATLDKFDVFNQKIDFHTLFINEIDIRLTTLKREGPRIKKEKEDYNYNEYQTFSIPDWVFTATNASINNGLFHLQNLDKDTTQIKDGINFENMKVSQINAVASYVYYANDTVSGCMHHMSAKEQSGFEVEKLTADVQVTGKSITLENLLLQTPNSILGSYLLLEYKSFLNFFDFVNRVKIDAQLAPYAYFSFKDIMYFAPKLTKTAVLYKYREQPIYVSGHIYDRIRKIKGKKLVLETQSTLFKGDIDMRGLPDFLSTRIDFNVDFLKTNMSDIRSILPDNIKIPNQFDKLGTITFSGRFSGFPRDFVADGKLNTAIGNARSDLKMTLQNPAQYKGDLAVENFDMGEWLDNKKMFGQLSFTSTIEGQGLNVNDLLVDISSNVQQIEVNGYNYTDIKVNGSFDKKEFLGELLVNDNNLQMAFEGDVNLNEAIPTYKFNAQVDNIHLQNLMLLKRSKFPQDIQVQGNAIINLQGSNIDNIAGTAFLRDVVFTRGNNNIAVDSLQLTSNIADNARFLTLNSDILDANFVGDFRFTDLPNAFKNYMHHFFPHNFNAGKMVQNQIIDFEIYLNNPTLVTKMFAPKIGGLQEGSIIGNINTATNAMEIETNVIQFAVDKTILQDITITASSNSESLLFDAYIDTLLLSAKQKIPNVALNGMVNNDSVDFRLSLATDSSLNSIMLDGLLTLTSDTLQLYFDTTQLKVNNKVWQAESGLFTYLNPNYFKIEDLVLTQADQIIRVGSMPSEEYNNFTGIFLTNVILEDFNQIPAIKNLGLKANIKGNVQIKDLFGKQIIDANINARNFHFLNKYLGTAIASATKKKNEQDLIIDAKIKNDVYNLLVDGTYTFPQKKGSDGFLDINLDIGRAQVDFIEAFLSDMVSNTQGYANGNVRIYGDLPDINFNGALDIFEAQTTVEFLQTTYFFDKQRVGFDDKLINFDGISITDRNENKANVNGFINLGNFKDLTLNLSMTTDNFLFLDTKYNDNESFYGTAYGGGLVTFKGPVDKIQMYINAKSNKGTSLKVPISSDSDYSGNNIYNFINTGNETDIEDDLSFSGFKIDFDLDLTPDAELQLIFDLQAGDIITSRGSGDIQMQINTIGDFTFDMYGNYIIEQGSYLFTMQNLFNKYFTVEPGGTVTFAGDPYNAILDIEAIYSLETSRESFFDENELELLATDTELKRRVPINVYLALTGILQNPTIGFKIRQQNETSSSRVDNLTRTKLEGLERNNQNELNKQVFGLLVLNSFMPPERIALDIQSGLGTTVSELLSNYLSSYLNQAIGNVIEDSELNVNWRNYNTESEDLANENRNEFEVVFTKRLFNDRLSIDIGGNVDVGNTTRATDSNVALAGDFVVEYRITADGRVTVRAFSKSEYDIFSGDFSKLGGSIYLSREFDSLKELFGLK